ncbi:MAG: lytic transglycosylase domain-containing protein [Polyangiaceae bacterium]|nr:lytic transglycosylase domain-containing protein [Polyangiaceae bacterium]
MHHFQPRFGVEISSVTSRSLRPAVQSSRFARLVASFAWAALLSLATSGRADIYQSVTNDGVITLSNRPGAKGRLVLRTSKPKSRAASSAPLDISADQVTRFDAHIRQAAALYQIPEELVRAVIQVESGFDPRAVSPANARGLMQLVPGTAQRMMVSDIFDPRQNIFGGVRYLRVLANLFSGDLKLTLAAYNAGENAVIRYGGIPPYEETQAYVRRVLAYYRLYRAKKGA